MKSISSYTILSKQVGFWAMIEMKYETILCLDTNCSNKREEILGESEKERGIRN